MSTTLHKATDRDPRIIALACVAAIAVAAWPIVATEFIALYDYPNHLARMHVLLDYDHTPMLQKYYEIAWRPLPNLAMEMVVLPLAQVLPLAAAGKAFVLLGLATELAGVVCVHRALHGRWSPWPLAAAMLLYNETLLFGFVNYLFGLGLALLFFAGWIALSGRSAALRLAVGTIAATIVFFCHISSFGVYAVLVCGYEAARLLEAWRTRRPHAVRDLVVALGPFVVPAVILFGFSPTGQGAATDWSWLTDKWHYYQKLGLAYDNFNTYDTIYDRLACAAVGILIAGGLVTRRVVFARRGFIISLAIFATFALAPKKVMTGNFLDDRLALAVAFVGIACTGWRGVSRRWQYAVTGVLAVLFVARTAAVEAQWQAWDAEIGGIVRGIDALPEGARLTAALGCRDSQALHRPPLVHLSNYVITRRNGFYPLVFAMAGQQPIKLRREYEALADRVKEEIPIRTGGKGGASPLAANPYVPRRLDGFDYILVVNADQFAVPPPPNLKPVASGPHFAIYRIEPPG